MTKAPNKKFATTGANDKKPFIHTKGWIAKQLMFLLSCWYPWRYINHVVLQ